MQHLHDFEPLFQLPPLPFDHKSCSGAFSALRSPQTASLYIQQLCGPLPTLVHFSEMLRIRSWRTFALWNIMTTFQFSSHLIFCYLCFCLVLCPSFTSLLTTDGAIFCWTSSFNRGSYFQVFSHSALFFSIHSLSLVCLQQTIYSTWIYQ